MKSIVASFILTLLIASSLQAQSDSLLQSIVQKQFKLQRTSTRILAGWSVANLAVSGIAIGQASGSNKYFHEMNLYWNVVNVGIAGMGLLSLRKQPTSSTVSSVVKEHYTLQKSLLLNSGLDIAYVTSGLWLLDKSKTEMTQVRSDRFEDLGKPL
jgi:acyl-ACP thioesterase